MALIDWRTIFTLGLIILIGWYLFGGHSSNGILNTIKEKALSLFSSFKSGTVEPVVKGKVNTGNNTVMLSTQSDLYGGKSFDVVDSVLTGKGMCDLSVASAINVSSTNIKINLVSAKVTFDEKESGMNINIHGTSSGFEILEENKIFPATQKGFDINVNCVSDEFSLTNIMENSITLANATGSVTGDRGNLKLISDAVEVDGFVGSLAVANNTANLDGNMTKILLN